MRKEYKIIDEAGLHARPVSLLVQASSKFKNDIFIIFKTSNVSLKSILLVMSLGVFQNDSIAIEVSGENPDEVFEALEAVLNNHNLI